MSAAGIPQLAAVMGSCTAGGAYVPAMADEAVIVRGTGTIFLGGPPLVKAATGEEVTAEELGGGDVHARISGVADQLAADDEHALALLRDSCARLRPDPPAPWEVRRAGASPPCDPEELLGDRAAGAAAAVRDPRGDRARRRRLGARTSSSRTTARRSSAASPASAGIRSAILANNGILFSESARKGAHFVELACQRGIPLRLPAEHHGLHGRQGLRARRHRARRREAGDRPWPARPCRSSR